MKKQEIINLIQERKNIMNFLDTNIDHKNGGYINEELGERYVDRLIAISGILRCDILLALKDEASLSVSQYRS